MNNLKSLFGSRSEKPAPTVATAPHDDHQHFETLKEKEDSANLIKTKTKEELADIIRALKRRVTQLEEEQTLENEFKHKIQEAFQSQIDALTAERNAHLEVIANLEHDSQQPGSSQETEIKSLKLALEQQQQEIKKLTAQHEEQRRVQEENVQKATQRTKEIQAQLQEALNLVDQKQRSIEHTQDLLNKERDSTKAKLDEAAQELNKRSKEFNDEKERLHSQLEDLNKILQRDDDTKLQELTKMLEQKELNIRSLNEQLKTEQDSLRIKFTEQQTSYEKELQIGATKAHEMENLNQSLNIKIMNAEKEAKEHAQQLEQLQHTLKVLETERNGKTQLVEEKNDTIRSLEDTLKKEREIIKQRDETILSLQQSLQQSAKQNEHLEQTKRQLENNLAESAKQHAALEAIITDLKQQNAALLDAKNQLEIKLKQTQTELDVQARAQKQLEANVSDITQAFANFKKEYTKLNRELSEQLMTTKELLEKEQQAHTTTKTELSNMNEKYAEARTTIQTLKANLQEEVSLKDVIFKNFEEQKQQNEHLVTQIAGLNVALTTLQHNYEELTMKRDALQRSLNETVAARDKLQQDLSAMTADRDKWLTSLQEMTTNRNKLQKQFNELEAKKKATEEELRISKEKYEEITLEKKDLLDQILKNEIELEEHRKKFSSRVLDGILRHDSTAAADIMNPKHLLLVQLKPLLMKYFESEDSSKSDLLSAVSPLVMFTPDELSVIKHFLSKGPKGS